MFRGKIEKENGGKFIFYGNLMRAAIIMKRHNKIWGSSSSTLVTYETDCVMWKDVKALRVEAHGIHKPWMVQLDNFLPQLRNEQINQ